MARMTLWIAQALSSAGTTVGRRCAWAWATADLSWLALASTNSDHTNAIAPVTKGAATLVPPEGSAFPLALRLVTPSPGALNPRRPMELPRFDWLSGFPSRSQPATGITHGWRVITELPTTP